MASVNASVEQTSVSGPDVRAADVRARSVVARAVLRTVAYSDIFDYPLTAEEIHRYLIGVKSSPSEVYGLLNDGALVPDLLSCRDGHFTLPGREAIVETRHRRKAKAIVLWSRGMRYGSWIASLPFVRMVAITGELSMDNVDTKADIDYLIVTEPGRLWVCRLLTVVVVRVAALCGDVLCPNYLISERALVLNDRNLYSAHEMAQMVPISGMPIYDRVRELNGWVSDFLPNSAGPPRHSDVPVRVRAVRGVVEVALRARPGTLLERWEMKRKVRKLTRDGATQAEASFSADWCKGHVDGHGARILAAYAGRCAALEGQDR